MFDFIIQLGLFLKKEIVIFDEAFSKVDETKAKHIINFFKEYFESHNMIGIIVTHFMDVIYEVAHIYTIESPEVIWEEKQNIINNSGGIDNEVNA